jgi:serine/threonine-protein kinase RsbW
MLWTDERSSPTAARDARRAAARWLADRDIDGDLADRVVLVVSELVTNSIRHARTGFSLFLRASDGAVRIEIFDADSREPTIVVADEDATSGRGIHIVSAVSSAWGSRSEQRDGIQGKVVWAELM